MDELASTAWRQFHGHEVVLDMASSFVCLGRLVGTEHGCLVLDQADIHDLRDTSTTREKYILDARTHGVHPNRRRAWVRLQDVIALSRLEDVVVD